MAANLNKTLIMKLSATFALLLVLLTIQCETKFIGDDRFMSEVNLEHYYVLEENALSNADVLLREDYLGADEEETEEEHLAHAPNLTSFKSVIDETKLVHQLAGPDLETFLAHPINMYHMFRRLDNGWRQGLDILLQTKPCKTWNLPSMVGRLRYLRENLPGRPEVERVVEYLATLQKIHRLNTREIAKGKLGEAVSIRPLELRDMFDIAKVLHDKDDMKTALDWLQLINEMIKTLSPAQREGLGFNVTEVLNMMASAFYYLKDIGNALNTTKEVLVIEPTNNIAQTNLLFFKNKLANEKEREESGTKKATPIAGFSKFERLCAKKQSQKISKKKCRLARVGLMFYNMEVIRYKPYIVVFHDVIRNKTADVIKNYTYEVQTEQAWVSEERFRVPDIGVTLDLSSLKRRTIKREIKRTLRHVLALSVAANVKPDRWEKMQVINVGLEGMDLSAHVRKLQLERYGPKFYRGESGGFFIFLNSVKTGGESVFMDNGVKLRPTKGSILFYHSTKTTSHRFCPVVGGSLWVAVQPVHNMYKFCEEEDEWWL